MKKSFNMYAVIWVIMLAVFNAVVFLVRPVIPGFTIVYDTRFWVAWGFILAAFIGNLICAYIAFKAENLKKLFYHIPLIRVSYSGLIVMTVLGTVLMLIPSCPAWIAAIVCLLVLAFTAIAAVKAKAAAEIVADVDTKVEARTAFIKGLTVDAESLLARAAAPETKAACKKVFEAVRYSDPMSNDALADIEGQIKDKFGAFSAAVAGGNENAAALAEELTALIGDRNRKCKALK